MKRLALFFTLACFLAPLSMAQSARDGAAVEYIPVVPAVATSSGDKIEVVEMFWYGCPHCYRLEPYIERWLESKPDDVAYVRIPAVFNDRQVWELHARTFYAMEQLGLLERLHRPFLDAIHAQRRQLNLEQQVVDWFSEQDVDAGGFRETLNSFAVNTKLNRAKQLTRRYGIDGVPTMIVEGRYRTGPSLAGTYARTMPVVESLIERSRQERKTAGR
jgi:thiol:disulfide interchange protein DsbA